MDTITMENINSLWASLIVEELVRNGIRYFCISPGSRSAPLTVAAARHPKVKTSIIYDERGAAFHALGYARAAGTSAAVIATSGTAVANYLPAVVEASMDNIPLLILSADRPPELQQTGANQTILQPGIFGQFVRWHFEFPAPDEKIPPAVALSTVDQAVYRALRKPSGPVHLNFMFREPLAPERQPLPSNYLSGIADWQTRETPFTSYEQMCRSPQKDQLKKLAALLNQTKRGLVTVGRLDSPEQERAVKKLAHELNWPLFPDVLSGLRLGNSLFSRIPYYDQMLASEAFQAHLAVETLLHFGGQLTSKRFLQFTEKYPPENMIVVKEHPFRHDPACRVSWRIEAPIAALARDLIPMIHSGAEPKWVQTLVRQSGQVVQVVDDFFKKQINISEPGIARIISQKIREHDGLFLAGSMPVRDMDSFGLPDAKKPAVAANRGTSGIDGTISTAIGFAAGLRKPATLLTGDLAFLHDLNALSTLRFISQPVLIVLINNQGGGIFSFLPIAEFKDVFEEYFAAPHPFTFEKVSEMFGIDYYSPKNPEAFSQIYDKARGSQKHALIEIRTAREANVQRHQDLQKLIVRKLETLL
ncbi:MAG TPA: 2-succinyl-5-enolpyruvyl-6-hydroxy-3-cyclohexene-1-carboxylic-acid synthase [Bacteroidetes bacterium]|nr:2-succinyl-5-enolpyruvyl-6-hydroxy-3-cyclohexene-1-carboxylic-acid synthase [Bacteroidota bacterium]